MRFTSTTIGISTVYYFAGCNQKRDIIEKLALASLATVFAINVLQQSGGT